MLAPVIGFDLDMTLLDTRAGIAATYRALTARTGVHVDTEAVVRRLGPPLRDEVANWFPPGQVDEAVRLYRELYPAYAITPARLLPGAREAVEAVRRWGGRVVVVTSKLGRLARAHLDYLALPVDEVLGDRFGPGKTDALREHGVRCYVGDHAADMRSARAAGAVAVGVTTGGHTAAELTDAGAELVLPDLSGLPEWVGRGSLTGRIAEDVKAASG